jgi:hypothetical protein
LKLCQLVELYSQIIEYTHAHTLFVFLWLQNGLFVFLLKKKLNKLYIDPLKKYPCLALHLSQSSLYINPIIINSYKLSLSILHKYI